MIIPLKRDIEILQYLYNEHHGTKDAAEKFGMTPMQISLIVHLNALNMADLAKNRNIEHAKNICVHEYGLSGECIEALIRQVTPMADSSVE